MEDVSVKTNISYVEGTQAGINKAGEKIGEKALGYVVDFIKKQYGNVCVETGCAFESYLYNSEVRYNKIKTLADPFDVRELEGEEGIYVDVYVNYKSKKIAVKEIGDLEKISNNIIIIGSGGTGKSIIMRHLFVDTVRKHEYIPVLVDLRKITEIEKGTELLDVIHSCIESFDVKLNQEQFEYSLRAGKYLFLLDGLDEVKRELCMQTEQLIQNMSKKFPYNCYVVSSRKEGIDFSGLETYTFVNACPLDKEQAISMIKKIGRESEKANQFSELLEQELYDKHRGFASNPLLLLMMYITFVDDNMIPEQLTDFYESAYNALYKKHDANKEGLFTRDYRCKKLGEREFKDLFAYFCFHSYFKQEYEFEKEDICKYIDKGITRLDLKDKINNSEDFFLDIKNIVCLIIKEGSKYKFAHRSFQTYFAAYYTAIHVTDEQQTKFFKKEIDGSFLMDSEFYRMLHRLEGKRFNNNIINPGIDLIINKMESGTNKRFELLKIYVEELHIHENELFRVMNSSTHLKIPYDRNFLLLFESLFVEKEKYNKDMAEKIVAMLDENTELLSERPRIEVQKIDTIKDVEFKNLVLNSLCELYQIDNLLEKIIMYKNDMEEKKELEKLRETNDELLDIL